MNNLNPLYELKTLDSLSKKQKIKVARHLFDKLNSGKLTGKAKERTEKMAKRALNQTLIFK